jgi:hypothetical protein
MVWNKLLPTDKNEIRTLGEDIRPNWEAIESADSTLKQAGVNLAEQGGDLAGLSTTCRIFGKAANGQTELFVQNSAGGDAVQLTRGKPTVAATGFTFLPGGIIMAWGKSTGITNNGTITVSGLTTIYQATFTIEDSSSSPASRAYISGISTNVITVKVPTLGSVVLRWIAIGV